MVFLLDRIRLKPPQVSEFKVLFQLIKLRSISCYSASQTTYPGVNQTQNQDTGRLSWLCSVYVAYRPLRSFNISNQ